MRVCMCVYAGGGGHRRRVWLAGGGQVYFIRYLRLVAQLSAHLRKEKKHSQCLFESPELVLNQSSHCWLGDGEAGGLLCALVGGQGSRGSLVPSVSPDLRGMPHRSCLVWTFSSHFHQVCVPGEGARLTVTSCAVTRLLRESRNVLVMIFCCCCYLRNQMLLSK